MGHEVIALGTGSALELYAGVLKELRRVSLCDVVGERAIAAGRRYGLGVRSAVVDSFPTGAVILNLTPPGTHGALNTELLDRGHLVYSEKPAVHRRSELSRLSELMDAGRRFAVAPDTHLSAAVEMARGLIAARKFGPVHAVSGAYSTLGHERWHPRPWIFYESGGGGVCLDIAPYFVRVLEVLLGPLSILDATVRVDAKRPEHRSTARVPIRAKAKLISVSGVPIDLQLAWDANSAESHLRFEFAEHTLSLDPVHGGSALRLSRPGRPHVGLVPETPDVRGAGLRAFLAAGTEDDYFGPSNRSRILRESRLLLELNARGKP